MDFFVRYMDGRPGLTDQELAAWGAQLDDDRANDTAENPAVAALRYLFDSGLVVTDGLTYALDLTDRCLRRGLSR